MTTESERTERVRWDPFEIKRLADAWVTERLSDPFSLPISVFEKAQRTALPDTRHRNLQSLNQAPDLQSAIRTAWQQTIDNIHGETTIVHVETQKPPDYVDLLHKLDTPSLVAMLVSRMGTEFNALKPLLSARAGVEEPKGAPLVQPVSLLVAASSKPRNARVLLAGLNGALFSEIRARVEELKLAVDLQFIEQGKEQRGTPVRTDYVIAMRWISHALQGNLKRACPPGTFFFLPDGGVDAAVQKLRDIAALLPPRA